MPSRPTAVLLCAWAALVVCGFVLFLGIRLQAGLGFFLPIDDSAASRLVAAQLRKGPASGLVFMVISGGDRNLRRNASDQLTHKLADMDAFVFVSNGTPRVERADIDALMEYRYVLKPAPSGSEFSAPELRRRLVHALDLLRTSFGAAVKRLLPSDPSLRALDIAEHWAALSSAKGIDGPWESRDGERALIVAISTGDAFNFNRARQSRTAIENTFRDIAGTSDLRLAMGGPGVIALETRDRIKREAEWLSVLSAVLVSGFLLIMFRSLFSLATLILPIAGALVAGAAAVQLTFGHVHGVTLAFGSVLIGVAVDYPIHLLTHSASRSDAHAAILRIWPTLRLGAMTTILAFMPLCFSSFPGLSQLGVFAAAGLLAAAGITRWVLPAAVPETKAPPLPLPTLPLESRAAARWAQILIIVGVVTAAMYLAANAAGIWDDDPRSLSPIPRATLEFDRAVRADIRAPDVRRLIVIVGDSAESVLREQEALAPALARLTRDGAGIDMAARYFPSMHAQAESKAAFPTTPNLRKDLRSALSGLPFRAGLFAPFIRDVERARTNVPVSHEAFADSRLGWRIAPLLFKQDGKWVGLITLAGITDSKPFAEFATKLNKPSIRFIDLKEESDRLAASYRQEALLWLAGGAVVAILILAFAMRSFARLLRVAVPVSASVILTIALLHAITGPLTIIHVMAILLVAGLGLDYALFLNRTFESVEDARTTATAVFLGNLTTIVVFVVLAFSEIPVLNNMGHTVATGAVLSILLASLFRRRPIEN